MPKVSPIQSNFNGGEVSSLLYGRVDADRYKASLKTCLNNIPTVQGGLTRRPGTEFIFYTKDNGIARLKSFEFSITQAYMLEFGDSYIRFYKDNANITNTPQAITSITQANPPVLTYTGADTFANGDRVIIEGVSGMTQVDNREFIVANVNTGANTFELSGINSTGYNAYTSGGTVAEIYEIVSPYQDTDVFTLKFTQSADVLYIAHPDFAPRKLTRTAHNAWTLTVIDFVDGPYLPTNTTTTTFTPGATTGTTTLVASSIVGVNGGIGFQATDVGRLVRIKQGSTWGYAKIATVVDTLNATIDIKNAFASTASVATWRLGLWSETTGYPAVVTFHEDRLLFGGTPEAPQRIDLSKSGNYEDFSPTATDGAVADDNALSFTFNANDVNVVRWCTSDEKGLLAGTVGGEWVTRPSNLNEALKPTNITAKKATSYGSEDVQPVQSGKSTLFIQRSGRVLRDMNYYYDVDGFRAADLTELSEHITKSGIIQLANQKTPQSLIWCVREDGVLACLTYDRDLDALKVGWHRHIMGGFSDAAGSDAIVESVETIPAADGTSDEAWVVVKRYINGGVKRHIEFITKFFEDKDEQRDAFFVDSGLTFDNPITITNITRANPAVVTAPLHGIANGSKILIANVKGMNEVNGVTYIVAGAAANTFTLKELDGTTNVNSTSYSPYVSGGAVRKMVSQIEGLNHLEGETVSILADGAVQPNKVVTKGIVLLSDLSATVHVGFKYNSDGEMLRLDAGAADGTSIGKIRRTNRVGFMLHRTLGLKIGMDFNSLDTITFRTTSDPMTRAPALFSGIISELIEADYDFENNICWRQDQPLPCTVLAIMPQLVTQDRG